MGISIKKIIIVLCSTILTACGEKEFECPAVPAVIDISHIQIIAHRGVTYHAPENGLMAISQAVDMRVDAVEFDIQLSRDGELVIFHDDNLLQRTGKKGRIRDFTVKELKEFRLINNLGEVSNEEIPTLREVLEQIGGKIPCFIELKFSSEYMEKKLISLLKEYSLDSMATILSFDNKALFRLHSMNKSLSLCLLLYDAALAPINEAYQMDYSHLNGLGLHYSLCKNHILENLKSRVGVDNIYIYTVNSLGGIPKNHFKWIDGVITDIPKEWMLFRSDCQ